MKETDFHVSLPILNYSVMTLKRKSLNRCIFYQLGQEYRSLPRGTQTGSHRLQKELAFKANGLQQACFATQSQEFNLGDRMWQHCKQQQQSKGTKKEAAPLLLQTSLKQKGKFLYAAWQPYMTSYDTITKSDYNLKTNKVQANI